MLATRDIKEQSECLLGVAMLLAKHQCVFTLHTFNFVSCGHSLRLEGQVAATFDISRITNKFTEVAKAFALPVYSSSASASRTSLC